jgi:NTP pyrophosphatase (non-canonical NTP hydrolase)
MTPKTPSLASLRLALRRFADVREWQQFHTPKNLAMALCVETAELLEHFQWLTAAQSARLGARRKRAVADEIADVLIYLTRLADVLEIDPLSAAQRKMRHNARKYPVARSRGNARKYNDR